MQLLIGSRATSISSTDFWIINELSWLNMTDTLLLSSSITNVCGNFGKIINSLSSGLAQVRRSWIETSLVHPCEDLFKRTVQKIMRWQPDLKQIYITLKSRQMSVVIRYYFLEFSNHCKIKLYVSIICYCSNFFTWSGFTEVVNNFQFSVHEHFAWDPKVEVEISDWENCSITSTKHFFLSMPDRGVRKDWK